MLSRLAYFPKMTIARWRLLEPQCRDVEQLWHEPAAFFYSAGWTKDVVDAFLEWRRDFDPSAAEESLAREHMRVVVIGSREYPHLLAELYDPPFALFVRGELALGQTPIAVVGTRGMTMYGKQMTHDIVSPLARAGCTIVSGLALGIDGEAHRTAIAAGGKTIAVLGTGCDRAHVYPAAHRDLADQIIAHGGAVVSEYAPGSAATAYSFPARNRIIAGLARGTLVIEAGASSGALITANVAIDQGREVFALPQNATSLTSIGPHELIKNGAHLVTSAEDIMNLYGVIAQDDQADKKATIPLNTTEAAILAHLSRTPMHIDALIVASELSGPLVMSTLSMLEIKGQIKNMGTMMYIRL